jgi:hypothetical protein
VLSLGDMGIRLPLLRKQFPPSATACWRSAVP